MNSVVKKHRTTIHRAKKALLAISHTIQIPLYLNKTNKGSIAPSSVCWFVCLFIFINF